MTKDDLVPNMTSAVAEKVCHRKQGEKQLGEQAGCL